MSDYAKRLTQNGITATSDGLLRDLVSRGNYRGVIVTGVIPAAIAKREDEIEFLHRLEIELCNKVGDIDEDS